MAAHTWQWTSALAWLFRIAQYVLGALAALFVVSWVLSTVFAS